MNCIVMIYKLLISFGCTRHSQGESQEGYTILYKLHLVFCARLLNFK